jgi:hypothetical protein
MSGGGQKVFGERQMAIMRVDCRSDVTPCHVTSVRRVNERGSDANDKPIVRANLGCLTAGDLNCRSIVSIKHTDKFPLINVINNN